MTASDESIVLLRLEGPLQSWGDGSRFLLRRTMDAPTKSGVLGLICCALGLGRREASRRLHELALLRMAVRIDRPGSRQWDYHTAGAGYGMLTAERKVKKTQTTGEYETLVSRREYLSDASFLVGLQGESALIEEVAQALGCPRWPTYLGRKPCAPAVPVVATRVTVVSPGAADNAQSLLEALETHPWRPRLGGVDFPPNDNALPCLLEWRGTIQGQRHQEPLEVWYDSPLSFFPPAYAPRLVMRTKLHVSVEEPLQQYLSALPRPRADYKNSAYRRARSLRLASDSGLCIFCKAPATTVQHITYRRAGGNETVDDLRSLCRLCHDAVTMIEYGLGMGLDRINPEDPQWREAIIQKRQELIRFRSLETRRRHLSPEEVE